MSVTLQTLRRSLGKRLQLPFFRQFGGGAGTATGGTTTTLVDTNWLKQADNYWRGQFVYLPASQEVREISSSVQSSSTLNWLVAVGSAVQAGTAYELWSQFTPVEVNEAINQALRDAWPYFFLVKEKFLVIQANQGTKYSLTGLSPLPRWLAQVQLEMPSVNSFTGAVTHTVAQNRLKDTNRTFTSEDIGKEVRVYAGTSSGDIRTIATIVDANTVEVSSNFTTTLDTTSKYRVVAVEDESHGYLFETAWSVDALTNPTTLRLGVHPYGLEGFTLRLLYEAEYPSLSAESDETEAPQEYVELSALARLYSIKMSLASATELRNWTTLYELYSQAVQAFSTKNRYQHLSGTWKDDQETPRRYDPEYPF